MMMHIIEAVGEAWGIIAAVIFLLAVVAVTIGIYSLAIEHRRIPKTEILPLKKMVLKGTRKRPRRSWWRRHQYRKRPIKGVEH